MPSLQKRYSTCKSKSLWYALAIIIVFGSFGGLVLSPADISSDLPLRIISWQSVDRRNVPKFILQSSGLKNNSENNTIFSRQNVDWRAKVTMILQSGGLKKNSRIGLMNFNDRELRDWGSLLPGSDIIGVKLDPVREGIRWNDLYPDWIDEAVKHCPSLPEPTAEPSAPLDLIAVKLPCDRTGPWSRDVGRLHLQLAAAKLATSASSSPLVLFLTDCFPIPNLFRCRDLVAREGGGLWLYRPDLPALREKLSLPVGSCTLSITLKSLAGAGPRKVQREAYATILHSSNRYLCGAIVIAQSIRMSGSTRDLVILVDDSISEDDREGLAAAGWKVRTIQRIRNPKARKGTYNEWNYSKFRVWQLTDYDKVIFVDADLLILRNIDPLFSLPEISATGNNATLFNSGVMVVEPSNCTFELLMAHIEEIESYNGGDQGYLNEIFTWWHRIPRRTNFLKHFWKGEDEETKKAKNRLFSADPPELFVLHFLGTKPWRCFRDYDCNWNVGLLQQFASDAAHERWWRVHDAMDGKLQRFCRLQSEQKKALEWNLRQAEIANFSDAHWRRAIADSRFNISTVKFKASNQLDPPSRVPTVHTLKKQVPPTLPPKRKKKGRGQKRSSELNRTSLVRNGKNSYKFLVKTQ